MRGAIALKPTQEWEPQNSCDPNKGEENTKRDKADWPVCREFPDFMIRRHRPGHFEQSTAKVSVDWQTVKARRNKPLMLANFESSFQRDV